MKAKKITEEEIAGLKIASLPARPTAPREYGGMGYTSKEMREAFDKLSLYIIERYNALIDDIETESSDSVVSSIKLGEMDGMSLADFIGCFKSGSVLALIPVGELTLLQFLTKLRIDVDRCLDELGLL